jgi:ABC-type lipoprotein export system ATPase subunit
MIQLKGIEKFYENKAQRTYVLRQISFEVKEGDFISIMGP